MRKKFDEIFLRARAAHQAIDAIMEECGISAKERNEEGETFVDHIFAETPRVFLVWTLDGRSDPNTLFAEVQYAYHAVLTEPGVIELTIFFDPSVGETGEWSYRLRDESLGRHSAEIVALAREHRLSATPEGKRNPISPELAIRLVREIGGIAASIADREVGRAAGG